MAESNPQIDAWLEGTLDNAAAAALDRQLAADPGAADEFVLIGLIHSLLIDHAEVAHSAYRVQGSGFRGQENTPTLRRLPRSRSVWYAAALIALAITAWFILAPSPQPPAPGPAARAPHAVAMLTGVDNATFTDASGAAATGLGAELRPGLLRVAAGTAQVMFKSTAVVDVFGPSEFELTGPNAGSLRRGMLHAFVPQRARGFTVHAGSFDVVDLGTEFEMRIHPDRAGELYVSAGAVELRPRDGADQAVRLVAGQGSLIDGSGRVVAVLRDELTRRTIYREVFATTTTEDRPIAEAGWRIDKAGGRASDNATLSGVVHDRGVGPIGSHPPLGAGVDAFMLTMDPQAGVDYLFWTGEHRIDHDRWRPMRMRWDQRHDDPSNVVRAALRIDGRWYALESPELTPGEEDWQHATLSLRDATWRQLDFTPGQSLRLGEIVTRQVGDITAFGLFVENRRGYKLRFDTIQIDAAPTIRAAYEDMQ